jgi:MATE family multidrug resistance protein
MGRTTIGMYITIGGLVLNVFLNWLLIYGNLGFPRMEAEGAALATLITRVLMTLAFVLIIWRDKKLRALRKEHAVNVAASADIAKDYTKPILRIGIPAGLQFFFEVAAFNVAQFMSGWLGVKQQAAHLVAIYWLCLRSERPRGRPRGGQHNFRTYPYHRGSICVGFPFVQRFSADLVHFGC